MLDISPQIATALEQQARQGYVRRMGAWLVRQPIPGGRPPSFDEQWLRATIDLAQASGLADEADLAEFAYVRLTMGDAWLAAGPAQEILGSNREGSLKAFQLRVLFDGISHG